MQMYISDAEACVATEGWKTIEESPDLLSELFKFSAITSKPAFNSSKVETLDVAALRDKLEEAGLDVDGSREVLIGRLEAKENGMSAED